MNYDFNLRDLVEILEIWMMLHKHSDPIEASPCILLLHIATPKNLQNSVRIY